MDVVNFIKEYLRMCSQSWDCEECPLDKTSFCSALPKERDQDEAEKIVRLVKEWSAAHPRKTRQSVFLEQNPEAFIAPDGVLSMCPANISSSSIYRGENRRCLTADYSCPKCRREFWMQEVE